MTPCCMNVTQRIGSGSCCRLKCHAAFFFNQPISEKNKERKKLTVLAAAAASWDSSAGVSASLFWARLLFHAALDTKTKVLLQSVGCAHASSLF